MGKASAENSVHLGSRDLFSFEARCNLDEQSIERAIQPSLLEMHRARCWTPAPNPRIAARHLDSSATKAGRDHAVTSTGGQRIRRTAPAFFRKAGASGASKGAAGAAGRARECTSHLSLPLLEGAGAQIVLGRIDHLDCDRAAQRRILREIDQPHSSAAKESLDSVRSERLSDADRVLELGWQGDLARETDTTMVIAAM